MQLYRSIEKKSWKKLIIFKKMLEYPLFFENFTILLFLIINYDTIINFFNITQPPYQIQNF